MARVSQTAQARRLLLCQKQEDWRTRMHWKKGCFAAALSVGVGNAAASQWFPVSGPEIDSSVVPTVEIDLETLHLRGAVADGVIRVSLPDPKLHSAGFGYRSFVATAQFDCQRRLLTLSSAAYFADAEAVGTRLGSDSNAREGGMPDDLLDQIPASARKALLRASCASVPGG
jgi:hypothetical protein